MALEGLAVLSLASNIAQLVEFSIKIGELTKSFRRNYGQLPKDLQRVENLVSDIVPIAERLQRVSDASTNVLLREQTLVSLLSRCVSEAQVFKNLLDSFKTASQTGWSSFVAALRTTRNAGNIDKIEKALESYKSALTLRIAEASLAKQEYMCELLNQNKQSSSEEAQTASDALERLDTSINASFRNMEDKMHHFSQQSENITEVAEKARAEIEKLHADHAAWTHERNTLQHRLISTHLASRPMILQFQTMQRRRARNVSRRTSTATASSLKELKPKESELGDEKAVEKKKAIVNINIVITLPVNATPEELMHSLKQLLYTSWTEVTRRITAAIPEIHHISDAKQRADEECFDRESSRDEAILLAFLETYAKDDVLIYDSARSTLVAEMNSSSSNMNLTCACDFYWKGISQRLLEIDAGIPSTFPTLQYKSTVPEMAVSHSLLENAPERTTKAELGLPLSKHISRSKKTNLCADRQERRRRRRSPKRRKVLVPAKWAIAAPLGLLSLVLFLMFTAYSFMVQDSAVLHCSNYLLFCDLPAYCTPFHGAQFNVCDECRPTGRF